MKLKVLGTIIVLLVILYFLIVSINHQTNDIHLTGFWKADHEFCNEAGLDSMIFYFDCNSNEVHIIIHRNNQMVENTRFKINRSLTNYTYNYIPFNNIYGSQYNEYSCIMSNLNDENDDDEENENFSWSKKKFKILISPVNGSMIILSDDVVYAKLYKDYVLTNKLYEYLNE